jgi:hypothetical protein
MSIRIQLFIALAAAGTALFFPAGSAAALPPSGVQPSLQAPGGPVVTEIPLPSPEVVTRRVQSAVPPKAPNPYVGTTMASLLPRGVDGKQQHFNPSPEQWSNARMIVEVVHQRGLPAYAAVISLATALQESTLRNLTEAVDYDSLGMFQQRPSEGWGTPEQLTDLRYAIGAFLDALQLYAPDYMNVPLWQSAQAAQRSVFPTLYAQWQEQAAGMVLDILTH